MHQGSPFLPIFCVLLLSLHCHPSAATFTPSIQYNIGLLLTCRIHLPPLSTPFLPYRIYINSHHMSRPSQYSLIHSTCQLHFYSSSLRTSSSLILSIRDTPTKHPSQEYSFVLSSLLIPYASAPYNAVGTITLSFRHFFAFNHNPYYLVHFSALHTLYISHSNSFYILYPVPLATLGT